MVSYIMENSPAVRLTSFAMVNSFAGLLTLYAVQIWIRLAEFKHFHYTIDSPSRKWTVYSAFLGSRVSECLYKRLLLCESSKVQAF
jgi:hypothetical protein